MLDGLTPLNYNDVFHRLACNHVRYVVVSGVAVVLHGYVRPIADLDIVIDPLPEEGHRAMSSLMGLGFVPTVPLPLRLVTMLRMLDSSNREVDLFVRYHISFDELWCGSERVLVGDSLVPVVSLQHLIVAKRINGRPHDLLDIERLLATRKLPGDERRGD
jgi:hypothetical protein